MCIEGIRRRVRHFVALPTGFGKSLNFGSTDYDGHAACLVNWFLRELDHERDSAVLCFDALCNISSIFEFHKNNSMYKTSPDPLSPAIEGCGLRDYYTDIGTLAGI